MNKDNKTQIRDLLLRRSEKQFGLQFDELTDKQKYVVVCFIVNDMLTQKRGEFKKLSSVKKAKNVYYMSMEFLLGRSLRNHVCNIGINKDLEEVLKTFDTNIDDIYEIEPDAGLGNGGLGRLAAAYLESLTNLSYPATGFSIKYDFGIFKQKIVDGWQVELPDDWLPDGKVWLNYRPKERYEVKFAGRVEQHWDNGVLKVEHKDCDIVIAVPYDMNISGYNTNAVNRLRLWDPKPSSEFDLELFSKGQYVKAMENKAIAESISKVLYPADNHIEGKSLRLKQQYFFVSASIQSIIANHLRENDSLDNLASMAAVHINDTHPTLCIPELMRILIDDYSYSWDKAWDIIEKTISYTNHTVMSEALEKWPQDLFKNLLPRIYQIIEEINRRFCNELWAFYPGDGNKVAYNSILSENQVKMANLCLYASNKINGVSALHSEILKNTIFHDYYNMHPDKFTNVTNGITYRRWLAQANPELASYIATLIGPEFMEDATHLSELSKFMHDRDVLNKLFEIRKINKQRLADYIRKANNVEVDVNSIFDVQIKRLHEYKRQLLNALHIIYLYKKIKSDKNFKTEPRTFIFGAKAAASYYMAKQIIKLICKLAEVINNDPDVNGMIKVVFIENYRISLSEIIIPAADISEQISIAGKEASGTGNMKFMINGAVTLGTMDGANVEISQLVGDENIVIFGLSSDEVVKLRRDGYNPSSYYNDDADIRMVIDTLREGIAGVKFNEIADSLVMGGDTYMLLADFKSYVRAQEKVAQLYSDKETFFRMGLLNTANSAFFSSDRSIKEYADKIWELTPINKDE